MDSTRFLPFANSGPSTPMNQSHISLAALLPNAPAHPNVKEWVDHHESIAVIHKRDDADTWRGWRRHLFRLVPFLTFANTGIYLAYLILRISCVIWAQKARHTIYAAAWMFIAVEIAVSIPPLMHNSWTMWSLKKRTRQKLRLKGYDVP
ncbi:glycosyl protein, partial [Lasius niger]